MPEGPPEIELTQLLNIKTDESMITLKKMLIVLF